MNNGSPLVVVGAGHAGCEAALAAARLGVPTLLLTMNLSTVALMPCNPSIGGPGKGHLVREIGALGGEMARCIDETAIQIKWLNTSKGAAVRARRAQADKHAYQRLMTRTLFETPNLTIRQGQVVGIRVAGGRVSGVLLETGLEFGCDRLVIATGTYLGGRIIIGPKTWEGGPHNQRAAMGLTEALRDSGVGLRRLQTATPPRIAGDSIDPKAMSELPGDTEVGGFLWENRLRPLRAQVPCFLTFTGEETIAAVRRNLKSSPLVLANITNVGPKHCPSIDRKVLKFPDQTRHQIFVEPEGLDSGEFYLQGLTTSMPPEAQIEVIRSVPGLTNARILRYGYAIEYDALVPGSIRRTMESRALGGLYFAGQINGTSGYEEAAAQGFLAGVNAALSLKGEGCYIPSRTQAYLGVLADDISVWDHPEPYRITPSHAEFRLHLRDETAEMRLLEDSRRVGLVSADRISAIVLWRDRIVAETARLDGLRITPSSEFLEKLKVTGSGGLKKQVSASEVLQRPGVGYSDLPRLTSGGFDAGLESPDEIECLETEVKYRGYGSRDRLRMEETRFLERIPLPLTIPEKTWLLLSEGARKVLGTAALDDLNQAARKNCLTSGDLAILFMLLKGEKSGSLSG